MIQSKIKKQPFYSYQQLHIDITQTDIAQTDITQTDITQTDITQTYITQIGITQTNIEVGCLFKRQSISKYGLIISYTQVQLGRVLRKRVGKFEIKSVE